MTESERKQSLKAEVMQVKGLSFVKALKVIPGTGAASVSAEGTDGTTPVKNTLFIQMTVEVESMVDIYSLDLKIEILDLKTSNEWTISLIADSQLTLSLRDGISVNLKKLKTTLNSSPADWNIQTFILQVQQNYTKLISIPGCLEPYQAEGSDGQSTRRFAVIQQIVSEDEVSSSGPESGDEDDGSEASDNAEENDDSEYWSRLEKDKEDIMIQRAKLAEEKRLEYLDDPDMQYQNIITIV